MKKCCKIVCLSLLSVSLGTLFCMETLPRVCANALESLSKQELYEAYGFPEKFVRKNVLPLHLSYNGRVIGLLCEGLKAGENGKEAWIPLFFERERVYRSGGKEIRVRSGLERNELSDGQDCSKDQVIESCSRVIKRLSEGWVESDPSDYPGMVFKKPTGDYVLFVKSPSFDREGSLFNALARMFNLKPHMSCRSEWEMADKNQGKIYLWVEKAYFEKCNALFKIAGQ